MAKKQIIIKFSHVLHESHIPDKDRQEISKSINEVLESIKKEVISFKGMVEVIESKNGKLSFLSTCKDTHVKDKMNELISHSMPQLRKD